MLRDKGKHRNFRGSETSYFLFLKFYNLAGKVFRFTSISVDSSARPNPLLELCVFVLSLIIQVILLKNY